MLKGDVAEIFDKMQKTDVLVVATSACSLTMSGMRNRFLPRRQNLGGHVAYFIIAGHELKSGLKLVYEEQNTLFRQLGNTIKRAIWGESVQQKDEAHHKNHERGAK